MLEEKALRCQRWKVCCHRWAPNIEPRLFGVVIFISWYTDSMFSIIPSTSMLVAAQELPNMTKEHSEHKDFGPSHPRTAYDRFVQQVSSYVFFISQCMSAHIFMVLIFLLFYPGGRVCPPYGQENMDKHKPAMEPAMGYDAIGRVSFVSCSS